MSIKNRRYGGRPHFDIQAGKQNGLLTVGAAYGFAENGELEQNADYIVKTTAELEALLMKL